MARLQDDSFTKFVDIVTSIRKMVDRICSRRVFKWLRKVN